MTEKFQLTFSHNYSKLNNHVFTTIRWLDSVYRLGKVYDVVLVADNLFHTRYQKGKARIIKMEIAKLSSLSDDFIRKDCDGSRDDFLELMGMWYSKKADWKGTDSEIQILTCEKVTK
jgi:hypothetical protein